MYIEEPLKYLEENYLNITNKNTDVTKQICSIFQNVLNEIEPIVRFMKKNLIYFMHPKIKGQTTHGIILAKVKDLPSGIFVYNSTPGVVYVVDTFKDIINLEKPITFQDFFNNCNLETALEGIDYIRNYPQELINIIQEQISKKEEFIANLKML